MTQRYSRPFLQQPQSPYLNTYHFPSSATTDTQVVSARTTHLLHLGVAPVGSTGCSLIFNCTATGSNVQWAEVGVFSGFFPTFVPNNTLTATGNYLEMELIPTLSRLGIMNISGSFLDGTAGAKFAECSFTGGTCYAGDELWLGVGISAATVPTFLANAGDFFMSGKYMTVVGSVFGRPSQIGTTLSVGATVGVETGLTWGLTGTGFPLMAIKLY